MKKKDKKLSVSKETLRSLGDTSLEAAVGAATSAKSNCTLCTYTCP
jgi:nicotinamide mononucleotide (NMN) deamidase PncC